MFEGGFLLSFQSGSLHSLNSVLTRLGGIWLEDSAKSRVTVGEKAWEALMSFPRGEELKVFELKVFEQKVF